MKKLLLGLGTLSLAILPVAAIASCSTSMTNEVLNIKLLSDTTTVTQAVIDNAIEKIAVAQALPSTTPEEEVKIKNDELILILKNVFVGVNLENINNFEISSEGEVGKKIILTGKVIENTSYNFSNDTNVLTAAASVAPTQNLAITLELRITQVMIDKAILDYQASKDEVAMAAALSPLFKGITDDYLKVDTSGKSKLLVEIIPTLDTLLGKICLIAAPDYFFTNVTDTILIAVETPATPTL